MPSSAGRRIRIVSDDLLDESGGRWDRIRGGQYFLTPDELVELGEPRRHLVHAGYGSPVSEVSPDEFKRHLLNVAEHRVLAFRHGEAVALLLDTSDC